MTLGGDVVGQPVEECVAHQFGKKQAHGELNDPGDTKSAKEADSMLFFVGYRNHWSYWSLFFFRFTF